MYTKKKMFVCTIILLAAFIISSCTYMSAETGLSGIDVKNGSFKTNSKLNVHFIDVGQGDSILIESGGKYMLIDAGENDKGDIVCNYLEKTGVKELEYVIGTHPHSDHIGGLDTVINNFDVKTVIMPDKTSNTKTFEDVLTAIENKNLSITPPCIGDKYSIGNSEFTILAPAKKDYGDDANNYSVGIKLVCGENSFVMCGDAEQEAEQDIINTGIELKADVLKLGHHGSSTSSSEAFLDAVSPSTAVIMCGKDNKYGHPHEETLEKLSQRGINTIRIDENGTVIAQSDGKDITWVLSESGGNAGEEAKASSSSDNKIQTTYILNTKSKKFHVESCSSVDEISQGNKKVFKGTRDEVISEGYEPCKKCSP